MKEELIKILSEKRDHLKEWLTRIKSAQEVAPSVQQILEQTEWEIAALSNSPEEADEIASPYLYIEIERDRQHLASSLPMMPRYEMSSLASTSATTTSGSSSIFNIVTRVWDLGTPEAQEYSAKYTKLYTDLQETMNRPDDIRKLLSKLGSQNIIDRFEEAFDSFYSYKSGSTDKKASALLMRNFLDGVQGNLFEIARKQPKENMTWKTMANRLVKPTAIAGEEDTLIDQEGKRSSLISRLSDILKDREGDSITNLEFIWTDLLDHVFTVLNLIRDI